MWRIIGKRKGKIEKGFLEDVKKRTRKIDVRVGEVSHISVGKKLINPLSLCFLIAKMEIIISIPRLLQRFT